MLRVELTIEILSDTCFSMPAALDLSVDTEVATDDLGLPMIPGKTLHALLRDTWLSLQDAIAKENQGPDEEGRSLLDGWALLGRPGSHEGEGCLRIGDARAAPEVRESVRWATQRRSNPISKESIRRAFFAARTLTAIDHATGAPETDTLRRVRVIPANTRLYTPLSLTDELTEKQQALLKLLLQLTRHAGINRNRGMGHIKLKPPDWTDAASVAGAPALTNQNLETGTAAEAQEAAKETNVLLHYRMKLMAPCIFRAENLDPNSCATHSFIPGSAIRGAIARVIEEENNTPDDVQKEISQIITSEKVRFLNAYIEEEKQRSLPTPITWRREKNVRKRDWSPNAHCSDMLGWLYAGKKAPEHQQQPLDTPFLTPLGRGSGNAVVLKKERRTHQRKNRRRGISVKAESLPASRAHEASTVYVYEALKAGQNFRGCIALPSSLASRMKELLTSRQLWIGKSARSGYGGAPEVEILQELPLETGRKSLLSSISANENFLVRLTSAAVLRDPNTGQFDPWQLRAALQTVFTEEKFEIDPVCVSADVLRAHNRLWRAELPTIPCAGAGSVALLTARKSLDRKEIWELQNQTIGERLSEGCGCFVLDAWQPNLTVHQPGTPDVEEPGTTPTGDARRELEGAQNRLYQSRLEQLVVWSALEDAESAHFAGTVSPAAIQRLRVPLRSTSWQTTFTTWLGNGSGALRSTIQDALKRITVAGTGGAYVQLTALLLQASKNSWTAPLSGQPLGQSHGDQERYRLVPVAMAETCWNRALASMSILYLDTLLSRLAWIAARNREERTSHPELLQPENVPVDAAIPGL